MKDSLTSRSLCALAAAMLWLACAPTVPTASETWLGGAQSRGLRVAILEYESALEARDMPRLERVWAPTPDQRDEIEQLFEGDPIELEVYWIAATIGTDLAIVDFDQTLRQAGHTGPKTPLTAALTPTPSGGWRITFLGAREGALTESQAIQGIQAGGVAVTGPAKESAVGPLSWTEPGRRRSVASLQADLVRRQSGEWVIVSLAPSDHSTTTRSGSEPREVDAKGLQATLREYEHAFEQRDADRLSQVWLMNPYERNAVEELFAWSSMVAIAIEFMMIDVSGDRAHLDFKQEFVMSSRPRVATLARRAFERALAAHDAQGAWDIDSLPQ